MPFVAVFGGDDAEEFLARLKIGLEKLAAWAMACGGRFGRTLR